MIDLGQVTKNEAELIVSSLRTQAHSHIDRIAMMTLADVLARRAGLPDRNKPPQCTTSTKR